MFNDNPQNLDGIYTEIRTDCRLCSVLVQRIDKRKGRMSGCPYIAMFQCCLLWMLALGAIGASLTASCPVLMDYSISKLLSPELLLPPVSESPVSGLLGVGVGVWLPLLPLSLWSVVSEVLDFLVMASTRLMVASRLDDDNSPVALARSFKPMMYFATLKSSLVSAPPFTFKPMEKMARSGNLTFLPRRSSSLVQTTASVRMPLIAPFENGVLWLAMCSASSSRPMVSSATTRGYHFS